MQVVLSFLATMTSISIQDICRPSGDQTDRRRRGLFTQVTKAEMQRRLLTVIEQAQMGLDYDLVLQEDPDLQLLVNQVNALMPSTFTAKRRHLRLNRQLQGQLILNGQSHWIKATVNLGYRRGVPKLIDWAVRRPRLTRSDSVKLWVTAEHFRRDQRLSLNKLKLVVIALNPAQYPQALTISWNHRLHQQAQEWIIKQLLDDGKPMLTNPEFADPLDLSQIPEVAI